MIPCRSGASMIQLSKRRFSTTPRLRAALDAYPDLGALGNDVARHHTAHAADVSLPITTAACAVWWRATSFPRAPRSGYASRAARSRGVVENLRFDNWIMDAPLRQGIMVTNLLREHPRRAGLRAHSDLPQHRHQQ